MILIFSVHFWDIHISPQLRVQRAWQRLLGARVGVQDCSREGKANEASKGYNQTHNCLKLHSYFISLSKTTWWIVIWQKSTDAFSNASHIPHTFSWNFTVCTTYICWSQLCSQNKWNTLHHKKRKLLRNLWSEPIHMILLTFQYTNMSGHFVNKSEIRKEI